MTGTVFRRSFARGPEGRVWRAARIAKPVGEIRGTGYVVDALEAALACFAKTESFDAAILAAAREKLAAHVARGHPRLPDPPGRTAGGCA